LLLLALLAASCAPGRTPSPAIAAVAPPQTVVTAPITTGPDQLLPLPDGPAAFDAISAALRQARHSIQLELYEFQRLDLAAMLLDAHDRGLAGTATKDPTGRHRRRGWAALQQR